MQHKTRVSLLMTLIALGSPLAMAADPQDPTSENDKVSYSLGVRTAENFQNQNISINVEQFSKGMQDKSEQKKTALTESQMQTVLDDFQKQHMAKMLESEKKMAANNLVTSNEFLAKNKTNPKVKTTSSGLQYEVLTQGKGESPKLTDTVVVNYRGTLLDGTEFDSSYKRNESAKLPLQNLIPGWQEALLMMKPGAKWKIYVPPQLGYGEQGAGNIIEPNSALIFEIELVDVNQAG